jgi:hypothetical protein
LKLKKYQKAICLVLGMSSANSLTPPRLPEGPGVLFTVIFGMNMTTFFFSENRHDKNFS